MTAKSKKIPTPDELLAEVRGKEEAATYAFAAYVPVIHELQQKGYSYAKIAEFLRERLGMEMTRGQVYRAYQMWIDEQNREDEPDPFEMPMDEGDRIVSQLADAFEQEAQERANFGKYPLGLVEHGLCMAADRIRARWEAEQTDEKAAEESDKAREKKDGQTKA